MKVRLLNAPAVSSAPASPHRMKLRTFLADLTDALFIIIAIAAIADCPSNAVHLPSTTLTRPILLFASVFAARGSNLAACSAALQRTSASSELHVFGVPLCHLRQG